MTQNKKFKKISDLTPDDLNANKGTERGSYVLEESVRNYGLGRSILVDRNGRIIAGNKTHATAGAIGIEDIETIHTTGDKLVVVVRDDLDLDSDPKARELGLVDNRASELGLEWDWENIAILQEDYDIDLEKIWREDELPESLRKAIFDDESESESKPKESKPALELEPRIQFGEVWQVGRHFIYCGDSTDSDAIARLLKLAEVKPEEIGMVWADPPYGIDIQKETGTIGSPGKAVTTIYPKIKGDETNATAIAAYSLLSEFCPNALQVWWGANHYAECLASSSCWIVWDKEMTEGIDFADAELAYTNSDKAVRIFRHQWQGFMKDSERGEKRLYPSQKPVALFEWVCEKYGKDNDIIIDAFTGSGISLLGSQRMIGDRRVIAIEYTPYGCELTMKRFEEEFDIEPVKIGSL